MNKISLQDLGIERQSAFIVATLEERFKQVLTQKLETIAKEICKDIAKEVSKAVSTEVYQADQLDIMARKIVYSWYFNEEYQGEL